MKNASFSVYNVYIYAVDNVDEVKPCQPYQPYQPYQPKTMFTGIITDIGKITKLETHSSGQKITIQTNYNVSQVALGASIACNGACLTVIENIVEGGKNFFVVDLSNETVQKTIFQFAKQGDELNLERALKVGDELGGHYVTGHVDCLAQVSKINIESAMQDANWQIYFKIPKEFAKFVASKGSVTINGVSLTVNGVEDLPNGECEFWVNIIPHTLKNTNLHTLKTGANINFEIDVIARYMQRMVG